MTANTAVLASVVDVCSMAKVSQSERVCASVPPSGRRPAAKREDIRNARAVYA